MKIEKQNISLPDCLQDVLPQGDFSKQISSQIKTQIIPSKTIPSGGGATKGKESIRGEHDKVGFRLAQILIKFNCGERLEIGELAQEFNVHPRTIKRDFQRLQFLPFSYQEGVYQLSSCALGKMGFSHLREFFEFCGLGQLFPSLKNQDIYFKYGGRR